MAARACPPSLCLLSFQAFMGTEGVAGRVTQHRFGETQADTVDKCLLVTAPVSCPTGLPWDSSQLFPWLFCTWGLEGKEGEPRVGSLLCLSVTTPPQASRNPCLETQWPPWPLMWVADSTSAPPCSLGPCPLPGSPKSRLPLLL